MRKSTDMVQQEHYRGRLAPSPTGYLHLGHARTFWIAHQRAREAGGKIVLRNDDLDRSRVREDYVRAFLEDLRWLGLHWDEGPDIGGKFAPYDQSSRISLYREALRRLREAALIYPCTCSRLDVLRALQAPHQGEEEPIYPGTCRDRRMEELPASAKVSWRLRMNEGEVASFVDGQFGPQSFTAGRDFGDFVIWRHDDLPSYQLACVVDDATMEISEVVRGADLLVSTARQLALYRALRLRAPKFFHCPLMTDERGVRLAKRHDSLSLRQLREARKTPEEVAGMFNVGLRGMVSPRR